MVRIISGQSQEDPNAALLQGEQIGQQYRQAQMQRAQLQQQQQGREMQMQELAFRMAKFKADRDDLLKKHAEEGNLAALQEMSLRAKQKPSQEMAEIGQSLLSHTEDPHLRAQMYPLVKDIIGHQERQEQMDSVNKSLGDLLQAGVLDESGHLDMQQRLASGASPAAVAAHLETLKQKHATDAATAEENQRAFQGIPEMIEASPVGSDRERARALLKEWEMSPSKQSVRGAGASAAENIREALIHGKKEQVAKYERAKFKRTAAAAALHEAEAKGDTEKAARIRQQLGFGVYGDTNLPNVAKVPQNRSEEPKDVAGPQTTGMLRHIAGQRAEKEKRYPGSTAPIKGRQAARQFTGALQQAKSEEEVIQAMQAAGMPLTQANLSSAAEMWRGRGK